MTTFAYKGNTSFLDSVKGRLSDAGFSYVEDVKTADVVMTFCTNMSNLEDLYFGDKGLVQVMKTGALLIDFSATCPNFAHEMNAIATLSELKIVEAPLVVHNMAKADAFSKDNLYCYASGEDDSLDIAKPILDAIFSEVRSLNSAGATQLARCGETLNRISRFISGIETNAIFRGSKRTVTFHELSGLNLGSLDEDTQALLDAAKSSSFEGTFTVEMVLSELSAVMMAADDFEVIVPQAESAFSMFELLAVIGGAELNPAALILLYDNDNDNAAEKYGLNWDRAESLYPDSDTGEALGVRFMSSDDDDDYDWDDDDDDDDDRLFDDPRFDDPYDETNFEEFGHRFDYSSN